MSSCGLLFIINVKISLVFAVIYRMPEMIWATWDLMRPSGANRGNDQENRHLGPKEFHMAFESWHSVQYPDKQSSWGPHGAYLGPTRPSWAACGPREPCYLGSHQDISWTNFALLLGLKGSGAHILENLKVLPMSLKQRPVNPEEARFVKWRKREIETLLALRGVKERPNIWLLWTYILHSYKSSSSEQKIVPC